MAIVTAGGPGHRRGCTVVMKPAQQTPRHARTGHRCSRCGLPRASLVPRRVPRRDQAAIDDPGCAALLHGPPRGAQSSPPRRSSAQVSIALAATRVSFLATRRDYPRGRPDARCELASLHLATASRGGQCAASSPRLDRPWRAQGLARHRGGREVARSSTSVAEKFRTWLGRSREWGGLHRRGKSPLQWLFYRPPCSAASPMTRASQEEIRAVPPSPLLDGTRPRQGNDTEFGRGAYVYPTTSARLRVCEGPNRNGGLNQGMSPTPSPPPRR